MLLFLFLAGWFIIIPVCVSLVSTFDFCVSSCCTCVPLWISVCVSVRNVMFFTQVAVSARQSLCAAVNLRLIYLSCPLFLVDYNYSLCTSVFHWKKDGPYSMCSHPNALSLSSFEVGWLNTVSMWLRWIRSCILSELAMIFKVINSNLLSKRKLMDHLCCDVLYLYSMFAELILYLLLLFFLFICFLLTCLPSVKIVLTLPKQNLW